MDELVNNWKAANELERFKQRYLDPLNKKVKEAYEILHDDNRKWTRDQKQRAKDKYAVLDTQNIDMHMMYNAVKELIHTHERQTDMLTEIYAKWYNNIAYEGIQPAEMMAAQAAMLQEIFQRVYDAIEPLKLELKSPQIIKYDTE